MAIAQVKDPSLHRSKQVLHMGNLYLKKRLAHGQLSPADSADHALVDITTMDINLRNPS